jgi:hypothetical protein
MMNLPTLVLLSSPTKRSNPYLTPRSSQSDIEVDPTLQSCRNDDLHTDLVFEFNAGLSEDCKDSTSLRSFLAAKFHWKPLKKLVDNHVPVVTKKLKSEKALKETDGRMKHNKKAINDPNSSKDNLEDSMFSSICDASKDPLVLKLAVPIKKARKKKTPQMSIAHPPCIDTKDAMTSMDLQDDSKASIDDLLTSTFIDDLSVNVFEDFIHDTNVEDSMDVDKENSDFRVERSFQAQGSYFVTFDSNALDNIHLDNCFRC